MSTVGLKLGSLVIRTISKPIATAIKAQAREHPAFRKICISLAQSLHRADMRVRLGLLRDTATMEKMEKIEAERKAAKALVAAKEKAAAAAAAADGAAAGEGATAADSARVSTSTTSSVEGTGTATPSSSSTTTTTSSSSTPSSATLFTARGQTFKIRPLSETKAIDRGAAFISEFFLFAVAGSLILFESLRARRKELNRRDLVAERLERLEERTRQDEERMAVLEEEVWRLKGGKGKLEKIKTVPLYDADEAQKDVGWFRKFWPARTRSELETEMSEAGIRAKGGKEETSIVLPASEVPKSKESMVAVKTSS